MAAFLWGDNGTKLTPEDIALQRAIIARRKAQGVDVSPIGSPLQGIARVIDALGDRNQESRLNAAVTENDTQNQSLLSALLGGGSTPPASGAASQLSASSTAPDVSAATVPTGDSASYIRDGLIKRGLPEHIADGFLVNFKDESGLNPGLNEAKPLVPGSRGGFGLYQLTGPRRTAYEAYAAGKGVQPDNVDAQLDFMMSELQGPEKSAAESIMKSGDTSSAAQAIVNNFLRPSPENRDRRAASYARLGGGAPAIQGDTAAIAAPAPYRDPIVSAQGYVSPAVADALQSPTPNPSAPATFDDRFNAPTAQAYTQPPQIYSEDAPPPPPLPAPVTVSPSPQVASVPSMASAAATVAPVQNIAPNSSLGVSPAILKALASPYANEQTKAVAKLLLGQQQQQQNAAQEQQTWIARQKYEQERQNSDPLRQLQIKEAQIKVDSANKQPLLNAGNGALYDPNSKSWLQAPGAGTQFRQASPEEAQKYGAPSGQFGPDGRFYPVNPPSGTSLSVDPSTGAVTFNQGAGVKPLTEGQSKDTFFTTRMTAATPTLDKFEKALQSAPDAAADFVPGGRYFQSEDYQLAKDAGRDFVMAYLRKDSGAAISKEEEARYSDLLLPSPLDKPAVVDAKRQRRAIAIKAIESGMPSNAVDSMLKAIKAVPGADQPNQTTKEKKAVINGYQIEEVPE